MSIPSILAKGTCSSLHTLSFEKLDHRHEFSFIQSPLGELPMPMACLLNSTGWISHGISNSERPKLNSLSSPTKSVLPSVSPISVNDTTILPAAQARDKGVFLVSLPFSPSLQQGVTVKAGQQVRFPVQASLLPLQFHRCCPWFTPSPFFPVTTRKCPNQSPFPRPLPMKIILLKSQVSQHIPLLKTFHGSSLMSELNQNAYQ